MRRILLVEDNADDIELTRSVLQEHRVDARIEVVEDGVEALAYLSAAAVAGELPELLIVDLNLPRMGGLELLRQVRADSRFRHLPVVILTSSIADADVAASYELGANSYVRKPVDYDEFVLAARKLGEYWLDINHPSSADTPR
ncbi:MAG: response regulator [Deltaproteobacteria bacterium]|nr:response regulator [Deltaproteobacteria bacterium]MDQ3297190.1 response regulator [Myxococcota bacterium]